MQQMTIAALLVTFPALVVIIASFMFDIGWLLPAVAATLFTALPFILAIFWLRNQRKYRATHEEEGEAH